MAIIPIRTVPDPVLREKSKRVKTIDRSIHKLIDDMIETMHDASGVGLAASQIGVSLRVIVICLPNEEEVVLINPQIARRSGERLINEACLSLPGYIGQVKRAESITVKGLDRNGKEVRIKATDLLAQALEHEINHINGTLYFDQLEGMDAPRKIEPEELTDETPDETLPVSDLGS